MLAFYDGVVTYDSQETPGTPCSKSQLRASVRSKRRERDGSAPALARALEPVLQGARCVIGYASLAGEPSIDLALDAARAAGTTVLLPVVGEPRTPLRFGRLRTPMGELPEVGAWRIREPDPEFSAAEAVAGIPPCDVLLVPGLAFTPQGARLGNGGGFYDRTFGPRGAAPVDTGAAISGPRVVGISYAAEIVEHMTVEPWDLVVDSVVTEDGERPCR